MPQFWISKYALTQGIFAVEANEPGTATPGLISVAQADTYADCYHGEGRDWHRTYEGAANKANQMLENKIKSLKAQLVKFQKMGF